MQAFGFLILGSALGIMLECAARTYHPSSYNTADELVVFQEVFYVLFIVSSISWGVGIYQLIRHVKARLNKKKNDVA
jgi:hypothetical protein